MIPGRCTSTPSLLTSGCAFEYCDQVRRGEVQLYRIETADKVAVGTIEVLRDERGVRLGEHLGPRNGPLSAEDERLVQWWFRETALANRSTPLDDGHAAMQERTLP
jgi:hypothetical protein